MCADISNFELAFWYFFCRLKTTNITYIFWFLLDLKVIKLILRIFGQHLFQNTICFNSLLTNQVNSITSSSIHSNNLLLDLSNIILLHSHFILGSSDQWSLIKITWIRLNLPYFINLTQSLKCSLGFDVSTLVLVLAVADIGQSETLQVDLSRRL